MPHCLPLSAGNSASICPCHVLDLPASANRMTPIATSGTAATLMSMETYTRNSPVVARPMTRSRKLSGSIAAPAMIHGRLDRFRVDLPDCVIGRVSVLFVGSGKWAAGDHESLDLVG